MKLSFSFLNRQFFDQLEEGNLCPDIELVFAAEKRITDMLLRERNLITVKVAVYRNVFDIDSCLYTTSRKKKCRHIVNLKN